MCALCCSPAPKRDTGVGGVSEKHFRPVFRKVPADVEVPEGKMCRLDCVVSGRPMPELFWYRDDVQVGAACTAHTTHNGCT